MKPKSGDYIFIHYDYHGPDHTPRLTFLGENSDTFTYFEPRNQVFSLNFNKNQRYCNGWHDLATAQSYPCPDSSTLPDAYNQCRHCQNKTGFNPAFYHASSVSTQQQARNNLPHSLYIAHFGPTMLKVGITWAKRGIKRLLDQGARSGLIIKTYQTAEIARQYEAKIAKLPGIAETVQIRAKLQQLRKHYDPSHALAELVNTRDRLQLELGITPEDTQPEHLDRYYFAKHVLQPHQLIDVSDKPSISGHCIGMIGSTLIMQQDNVQFMLPLSKLQGYKVQLDYNEIPNQHEPIQTTLF